MSDIDELQDWLVENDPDNSGRFDVKARSVEEVYRQAKAIGLNLTRADALDVAEGRLPLVGRRRGTDGVMRTFNPRLRAPVQDYRTTPEGRSLGWRIGLP